MNMLPVVAIVSIMYCYRYCGMGSSPPPFFRYNVVFFLFTALFPFVVIVVVAATLTSTAIDTPPHLL